jgi:hypothetical protein
MRTQQAVFSCLPAENPLMSLPIEQWQESLVQMEAALTNASRSLDRAEERWERAVAPSAGEGETPLAFDRLDSRLEEWEARLRAAESLTSSVETELADRAAAVARWRGLFAQWEELLKRRESTSPVS